MDRENREMEIDLLELLMVLRARLLPIIIAAVLFAGAAGVYSFFIAKPVYKSTAKIYILTQSTSITSLADIQVGSSLATDYLELIKSRPVVEEVIKTLNLDMEYEQVLPILSVENPADTRILNISITGGDARLTKEIANEFADVSKRRISEIMQTDEPTIVENAVYPKNPIKPEKTKNVAMGFLLGAILAAFIIIIRYLTDDSIKSKEDVSELIGLNVLGAIPYIEEKDTEGRRK